MVTPQLLAYIAQQLNSDREESFIRDELAQSGWSAQDIDNAFLEVAYQPRTPQQSALLNHLMSPSLLLSNSWSLYTRKWKKIIKILIFSKLFYIPLALLGLILFTTSQFLFMSLISSRLNLITILIAALFFILFILSILVIQGCEAIALLLCLSPEDDTTGVVALYKKSFKKVASYWLLACLAGFITLTGFLLFVVPGIAFLIWFTFSFYILVYENRKGMDALLTSKEYVKGRALAVLGRLLFIMLIVYTLAFIIKLVQGYFVTGVKQLNTLQILSSDNIFSSLLVIFIFIIGEIISTCIMSPVSTIYHFLLYNNVKQVHGDVQPVFSKKSKIFLFLPGIIGILILILLLGSITSKTIMPYFQQLTTPKDLIEIKGDAMAPNYLNGEYYSVDRNIYKTHSPQRGEIILFTREKTGPSVSHVKRIIGLPGETIQIKVGTVYIDGNLFPEPYLAPTTKTNIFPGTFMQEGQSYSIPQDHYFVLGDNRDHSSDSREWGFIPKENIYAKVLKRAENVIPTTIPPVIMKFDLIDSITQKVNILSSVKNLCGTLPSYQNPKLYCVITNETNCPLKDMSLEELKLLNTQGEQAITDCVNYQAEIEGQKKIIPSPSPTLNSDISSAPSQQDYRRKNDQTLIQTALEMYKLDHAQYPTSLDQLVPQDLVSVPTDPQTSLPYKYSLDLSGGYSLCINFDSTGFTCVHPKNTNPSPSPTIFPPIR